MGSNGSAGGTVVETTAIIVSDSSGVIVGLVSRLKLRCLPAFVSLGVTGLGCGNGCGTVVVGMYPRLLRHRRTAATTWRSNVAPMVWFAMTLENVYDWIAPCCFPSTITFLKVLN